MRRWLLAAALLLVAAPAHRAPALHAQMGPYFGQNQVQYRKFRWQILRTPHFDVHYYPELEEVAKYTGQMAERSYERLRRVFGHEFRERKPIIIWGSRNEFAQNNVIGDAGEGTLGVTDALRQRNMFFFAGDMRQSEHTLTHEMVHVFQFDIFARGRAGAGLQDLGRVQPPLWFMEGMAEYVTNGPGHNATEAVMRDAALNGNIPSVQQMTQRPDLFFPYRFGESFWEYVAGRWGDEVIGEVMNASVSLGIERAFRRYTGTDLEDLGEEWKEHVQTTFLPGIAELERPRRVAQPMLSQRRTGGLVNVYVAPALSPDGRDIAFISLGSLLRAEVFLDLYLADANTGERKARLTKSTLNPEYEELRYGYSQGAFSPDGRYFAFTAQRNGKDILYIHDVRRNRTHRRLETELVAMIGPTWSPDGRRIVFSGLANGMTDLYMIDADGRNLRQLTDDVYGDLQPSWSPDGRWIAFASERGPQTDLETLKFGEWQISVLDLESNEVRVLPQQAGKNLNPQWAPDGQSIAFLSDRTGIAQLFLFDLNDERHYQLTKFVGGITSLTEHSPAITWAQQADKLAFVYQDNGDYQVWSIANPRALKKQPFVERPTVIADADSTVRARTTSDSIVAAARADADSAAAREARSTAPRRRMSVYLGASGWRPGDAVMSGPGGGGVSIAALNDSASLALPDAATFRKAEYRSRLAPEYVARPQIGYAQDNFGRGVFGQTAIVLSDLVGNRRLAIAGGINGRISEAQVFALYSDFSGRTPWSVGLQQYPFFFLTGYSQTGVGGGTVIERQTITRFISRSAVANASYPLNRFSRFEYGATLNNIDRALMYTTQQYNFNTGFSTGFFIDSIVNGPSLNYAAPYVAFVHDNALMGATGGIYGRRSRFQIEHTAGTVQWTTYTVDYRRYDALLFSFLTLATRFSASISAGPDELEFPKYIGRPDFIRGYDRETYAGGVCETSLSDPQSCSALQLLGSRVAFANAELRFPLVRQFVLGVLPIALPPVDGLFFYDVGAAWSKDQRLYPRRPDNYDFAYERYPLRSYGFGIRLNLFNIALVRWDYSIPLDGSNRKGYWFWTLGQSF